MRASARVGAWALTDGDRCRRFEFNRVFDPESSQESVFADVEPLVTSVLDGYHATVFAYGQTGSGKTFTMEGPTEDPGVNHRAIRHLYAAAADRAPDVEYAFRLSILEIYNELVHDLLVEPGREGKSRLEVRRVRDGDLLRRGVCVSLGDLTSLTPVSAVHVWDVCGGPHRGGDEERGGRS